MKILLCSFVVILASLPNVAWCDDLPPMPSTGIGDSLSVQCESEGDNLCACGTDICYILDGCFNSKCVKNHFATPICEEGGKNCYCGNVDHGHKLTSYRPPASWCYRHQTCKNGVCEYKVCEREGQKKCICGGKMCYDACLLSQGGICDRRTCKKGHTYCNCGEDKEHCNDRKYCKKGKCQYTTMCKGEGDYSCACGKEKIWCLRNYPCTKGKCVLDPAKTPTCGDVLYNNCYCGTEKTFCPLDRACVDGTCVEKPNKLFILEEYYTADYPYALSST